MAAGGTAVGGAVALLSAALAPALGQVAVDLCEVLPAGLHGGAIGAGTTIAELAADARVRRDWPAIAQAASAMGTPQVRAAATVGGTLGARLPTSDLFAALVAHDTVVSVRVAGGTVDMPIADYLSDAPPIHLVLAVRPRLVAPGAHRRFALRVGPSPAIAVVAGVRVAGHPRMYAGAVGPTAVPIPFSGTAAPGMDLLRSDTRASARYRHSLLAVLGSEVLGVLGGAA